MRARVWCSLLLFAAPVPQAVTLNGKAFPQVAPYVVHLPPARRTIAGDGSDLQTALRALKRGDQLRVKAGTYVGDLKIDANCQSGPITIVFDVKSSVTGNVTIARPDWHLSNLFVTRGAIAIEASSVTIDRLRIAGSVT